METTLTTDRLLIGPLLPTDHQFISALVNSKGWLEFIGGRNVHSEADAIAYIQKINDNPDVTYWVVRLKDDGAAAGVVTLIKRSYLEHHDIGFAFLPVFAGKGYAYESVKAVLSKIINEGNHTHILATTMASNSTSIKLLEKLGFKFEKDIQVEDQKLLLYSSATDKL